MKTLLRALALLALLAAPALASPVYISGMAPVGTVSSTDLFPDCALGGCGSSTATQSATAAQLSTFFNAHLPTPFSIALGGTGLSSWTVGAIPIGNGTTAPTFLAPVNGNCAIGSGGAWTTGACGGSLPTLTNGQILGNATGSTTTATATNLVAGSGITLTATGGNITIGASGSGGVSGPGSSINGDLTCWNGTAGAALSDCGLLPSALVPTSRTISTTTPLTGGGGLGSNLTLGITVPSSALLGGSGGNFTSVGIPTASLLSGTGAAFTGISLGSGLSITSNVLNTVNNGTVTSVGLTAPTWLTVTGTPVTSAGTLTMTGTSESANTALLAPNGSAGAPGFRLITNADLPSNVSPGTCTNCGLTINANGFVTAFATGAAGGTGTANNISATPNTLASISAPFTTERWLSSTASAKTDNVPGCVSGLNNNVLIEQDAQGTAGAFPITVTPASGTIGPSGSATFSIGSNYGIAAFQCDGPNTTWRLFWTSYQGSAVRYATATTLTLGAADNGNVISQANAAAVAATIAQAGTAGFPEGAYTTLVQNTGAGAITLTPTTSTINGASSIVIPAGSAAAPTGLLLFADNSGNYVGLLLGAGGGGSSVPNVVSTGSTVTLPTTSGTTVIKASASLAADFTCSPGLDLTVKDGLGNDATDHITLTPSSGTIDGASTFVMEGSHSGIPAYEARRFQCDASGNAWLVN